MFMKQIDYPFNYLGIDIFAKISIQKDFSDCVEFIQTPFSTSSTILPSNMNLNAFDQVVIRCFLEKEQEDKLLKSSLQPQSICVKIIEDFIENESPSKLKILHKTLTCNPCESQYLFLIEK